MLTIIDDDDDLDREKEPPSSPKSIIIRSGSMNL